MSKKVLAVDDSPLILKMYDAGLKAHPKYDIEVSAASSGEEALSKLTEQPDTELIMLDINMPGMTGLELLKVVKQDNAFKDIIVILASTEDQMEDVARGKDAGAVGYLTKPFTVQQLHDLVDKVFSEQEIDS